MIDDSDYEHLDPGIRDVVRILREAGFETTDSGDGSRKPEGARAFEDPHVICMIALDQLIPEADRLHRVLGGLWRVEASYCPNEQSAVILAYLPNDAEVVFDS